MGQTHTSGPWTHNHMLELIGDDRRQVMVYRLGIAHGHETPRSVANSRLIVAAPELLDAAMEAADALADFGQLLRSLGKEATADNCAVTEQAVRAVIAKATSHE